MRLKPVQGMNFATIVPKSVLPARHTFAFTPGPASSVAFQAAESGWFVSHSATVMA